MKRYEDNPWIEFLPESLWKDWLRGERSSELTVVFVERKTATPSQEEMTSHDFWELLHVYKGKGQLTAETTEPLRAGETWLIAPGVAHKEYAKEKLDLIWVGLEGGLFESLGAYRCVRVGEAGIGGYLERLWQLSRQESCHGGAELEGLARAAMALFYHGLREKEQRTPDAIGAAMEYLMGHYAETMNMAELASRYGLSEGYFYRQFRKRTGQSPKDFLSSIQCNHARSYLERSSMSIEQVAHAVGYEDALYFSRVFRRWTGMSPSEFRQESEKLKAKDRLP